VRRYDFEPKLQRMSVLVTKNGEYVAFVKGSPEKIAELCDPGSLPENY
jgi:cation-transporting ATPase 13A3/4/5